MSPVEIELLKAILAGCTAGVVFVIGQVLQRFLFEPLSEMKKLLGQVGADLVFYSNLFSSPENVGLEKWIVATETYRRHAASLRGLSCTIPFYDAIARLASMPSKKDLFSVSAQLIGLSNMSRTPSLDDYVWKNERFADIYRILGIPREP